MQAALALILDFPPEEGAAVAILKHNTPCGVGQAATPLAAWELAFATDPDSPFGGIVVSNRPFDLALARAVDEIFTEVLLAPDFAPDALEWLRARSSAGCCACTPSGSTAPSPSGDASSAALLVQEPDVASEDVAASPAVTARKPSEEELRALRFAWKVVKHVKSNAVVFARADRTLALGGGATSRVDAIHAACAKAARVGISLEGSVLASDAFFPFPDGLEAAVAAGARAVVQPGGSLRDAEVIAAADRLGVAMIFTGVRHFRH